MPQEQSGILAPLPAFSRHCFFEIHAPSQVANSLMHLSQEVDDDSLVVGIGLSAVATLGREIKGLVNFPAITGPGIDIPSTQAALWCWLRGSEPGELFHSARALGKLLSPAFKLRQNVELFRYNRGLDLTGYEDGTENPKGDEARSVALVTEQGNPLAGSSFVAVQQWQHDFEQFESLPPATQDDIIGRRRSDNEELESAPMASHVKRTAQESFEPPAFMFRRSMPWAQGQSGGLMFVAFGRSFYAFDASLRRMAGQDDGITDALFSVSRPMTGSYFWCPPLIEGHLDLTALEL
ncbi:Dyp-type peroxidase [Acidihalobacter prosperus]